jgi:hypothetical protein
MSAQTVFLSYRPEDATLTQPVQRALTTAQLVIVDREDPRGIENAISDAGLFVGCVSAGGYAAEELQIAIAKLQGLERNRSWLIVVRLEDCDVPALPITPKFTLRDFLDDVDAIVRRLSPKEMAGKLVAETKAAGVQTEDAIVIGAVVNGLGGGDYTIKTDVGTVTGDKTALIVGAKIDHRKGNAS